MKTEQRQEKWLSIDGNESCSTAESFPDNRSHLCQVVEPEGFPPRLGDEVTIRYSRCSASSAGVWSGMSSLSETRGEKEADDDEDDDEEEEEEEEEEENQLCERKREREREKERGRRTKKEKEGSRLERGRRQLEEERITVLSIPGAWQSSFQGSRTPVDRAEFEGRCSSFVLERTATPGIPEMT